MKPRVPSHGQLSLPHSPTTDVASTCAAAVPMKIRSCEDIMSRNRELYVIINPASAGGRTAALGQSIVQQIKRETGRAFALYVTRGRMDAMDCTAEAVEKGFREFLVIGGDGTINEVVNGLFQTGSESVRRCTLGIISSGSGEGLARSLGLPRSIAEQIRVALHGQLRKVDLARIETLAPTGMRHDRVFVNECQIGIGAEVVRRTTSQGKRAGGLIAYGLCALRLALQYRSSEILMTIDGERLPASRVLGIACGNGAITAGGMRLTPTADPSDGMLDILIINDQTLPRRIRSFSGIYSGRHVGMPGIGYLRGAGISLESDEAVPLSADGEFLGHLPCSIELLPSLLRVRCSPTEPETYT